MSEVLKIKKNKIITKEIKQTQSKKRSFIFKSIQAATQQVSPLWDVHNYVAVNPFFGLKEQNFLDVAKYMRGLSGHEIIPKKDFFLKKYNANEITDYDLEVAKKLFLKENEENGRKNPSVAELVDFISLDEKKNHSLRVKSISDIYDLEYDEKITGDITHEVSKWASAYFDEGQALWKISTDQIRFYTWWRSLVQYDHPFGEKKDSFLNLVKALPHEPDLALEMLTDRLMEKVSLDQKQLTDYYYRLLYTVLGWASYIQKFEFEAQRSQDSGESLQLGGIIDILAIRMAYDISLRDEISEVVFRAKEKKDDDDTDLDFLFIWLNAAENAYRREIEQKIRPSESRDQQNDRAVIQMAFCIDVRSEVLRRHLEKASKKIETIGFAGFFGLPIAVKGLGHSVAEQNCPALLSPRFEIGETASKNESSLTEKKQNFAHAKQLKNKIKASANCGFSFVETFGVGYAAKMILSSLGKLKTNINMSAMGLGQKEQENIQLDMQSLSFENKVSLGFNALKNMGLISNFAKYVFFLGHGSETSNNAYASALECGACAGHNGQANAQVLANILNDTQLRLELKAKGIDIPEDTVFMSGWHNTVKDELIFDENKSLNQEQKNELSDYQKIFDTAIEKTRFERAQKMPWCSNLTDDELKTESYYKANDWSEIRPEWGLAKNASFIIGRRKLTRELDLEGRAFLHDYDSKQDPDLAILELIMTAPMIVTNWINMQYYASTVAGDKFGAGNKVINNVVGGIGCLEGNQSDLLSGLTEQSVCYQGQYFHEPLRLQVFIEADPGAIETIMHKHQIVRDLIQNSWLKVISIDPEHGEFKIFHQDQWIQIKEDLWN